MDWSALVGGLIGAGIPAILAYLGLRRHRQGADAEAFGPAVLLLDRVHPDRVTANFNPHVPAENAKWASLRQQLDTARAQLLIVSAGNPRQHIRKLAHRAQVDVTNAFEASSWAVRDMQERRDPRGALERARRMHAKAEAGMQVLIEANFSWKPVQGPARAIGRTRSKRTLFPGSVPTDAPSD
jgi:hypothetical protein